jgi:DNA-binding NtrC family response regulator
LDSSPLTSTELRPAAAGEIAPSYEQPGFAGTIAQSPAMRAALARLQLLASSDVAILLVGETGTGKTRLARAIHEHRNGGAGSLVALELVALQCARENAAALTGEVFATAIEQARGGTLLIEDVAQLSLDAQAQLLAAMRGARARTGDDAFEARIVATTQHELETEVLAGHFLRELYFQVAKAMVRIPPLRERAADLPLLVRELLDELGRPELSVSNASMERLRFEDRPGNVRELRDTLAQTTFTADRGVLEPHHFPALEAPSEAERLMRLPLAGLPLGRLEQAAIVQTLALCQGNKVRAARVLRIAVSTLYEKLKRHGL